MSRDRKKVSVFDSEDDLSVSLAKYTAEIAGKFAAERGAFSVVLSGGSLVKSLRYGECLVRSKIRFLVGLVV